MKVTNEQVEKAYDYLDTRLKKLQTDRDTWGDYINQVIEKSDEESALEVILSTVILNKGLLVLPTKDKNEILEILLLLGYTAQIKPPKIIDNHSLCQILYWKE